MAMSRIWVGYTHTNQINLSMDTRLPYPISIHTQLLPSLFTHPVCLPMDIHTLPKPDFYKITKYAQKPLK